MRKLDGVEKRFSKFYREMLNMTQVKYTSDTIILYLQSLFDERKLHSTIQTEWTLLRMISKTLHNDLSGTPNATKVNKFLDHLKAQPIENNTYKTKSVANRSDLRSILQFLWTEDPTFYTAHRYRLQLALFLLVASFTASRPGAIVEGSNHRSSNESLLYGETKLLVLRDEATNKLEWVLAVYFHKRKNRRWKEEACFHLRDIGDDPMTWPVLLTRYR
ncbi:hypothetical protein EV426DRAFT_708397 [Tirmania nivea]|nr:hypothetical protein EV426DRAFT_708397 [Tirmania nivea]